MERETKKRSWWRHVIDTIRTLAAVVAVARLIMWLIRCFEGDPS